MEQSNTTSSSLTTAEEALKEDRVCHKSRESFQSSDDQELATFKDLTAVSQLLRLAMPLCAVFIISIVQILLFYI